MQPLLPTKQALKLVHEHLSEYSLAFDTESGKLLDGFLFSLIEEMSDDDSDVLLKAILGDDYEDRYAGDYRNLITEGERSFKANFELYLQHIAFPFEKTSYNYGADIQTLCSVPNTEGALQRLKFKIPDCDQIIQDVYFNELCKESLEYLNKMPLSEFTMLKLAIDIRTAGKSEVEYKRYQQTKSANNKR